MNEFFLDMSRRLSVHDDCDAPTNMKEPLTESGSLKKTTQLTGDSFDTEWKVSRARPLRALIPAGCSQKLRSTARHILTKSIDDGFALTASQLARTNQRQRTDKLRIMTHFIPDCIHQRLAGNKTRAHIL